MPDLGLPRVPCARRATRGLAGLVIPDRDRPVRLRAVRFARFAEPQRGGVLQDAPLLRSGLQLVAHDQVDELLARMHVELRVDVLRVRGGRVAADDERIANVRDGTLMRQKAEHLGFARRQLVLASQKRHPLPDEVHRLRVCEQEADAEGKAPAQAPLAAADPAACVPATEPPAPSPPVSLTLWGRSAKCPALASPSEAAPATVLAPAAEAA